MAKMINCSLDTLLDTYLNQDEDLKYQIIKQRAHVRIPETDNFHEYVDKDLYSQPTDIRAILDRDGIKIHSTPEILTNIKCNSDIYILEGKFKELDEKSLTSGVALLSSKSQNVKSVTRSWYGNVSPNNKNFRWSEFFAELYESPYTPSNSAIIIDRYLFSFEKIDGEKSSYKDGIRNLHNILEGLLPKTFNSRYDILVIFGSDPGVLDNDIDVHSLVDCLYDMVEEILRPYPINVEFLAISKNCPLWGPTHDRRIISNFFLIQAPHGFKAVRANGYGTTQQLIDGKCVYNGIDSQRQRNNGLVVAYCEETLKIIKNSLLKLSQYDYICYNIESECYVKDIKNRLLRE